jgi:hypothetical protein
MVRNALLAFALMTALAACKGQPKAAPAAPSPKSPNSGHSRLEETFSPKYGETVLRGLGMVGGIDAGRGRSIAVAVCETRDVRTHEHARGIIVYLSQATEYNSNTVPAYLDYDEIPSILSAVGYVAKVDHNSTRLPAFQAEYVSRGGLSISVIGPPAGSPYVEFSQGAVKIDAAADRLSTFGSLISQAKVLLDAKTTP